MKYTEEQIKEFASKQYPGVKSVNNLGRQAGFISGFKKAMELLQKPATKPLSEITDEDAIEVAKLQGYDPFKMKSISVHFDLEDGFMVCLQTSHHDNYDVVNIHTVDFLRSKGYILPTIK